MRQSKHYKIKQNKSFIRTNFISIRLILLQMTHENVQENYYLKKY